uniref:Epoxide hydrolase n=1 Tax=Panagrellus redivivus TaxID=6233 RepID=A0A7E4UUH6_PANRE
MGLKGALLILVVATAGSVFYLQSSNKQPYEWPRNGYFGPGHPKQDDTTIRPFKINVSEEEIKELKRRLQTARIGHEQLENVSDFTFGFNKKTLLQFRDYWLNKYDWRKAEAQLNAFPQFTTQIEGVKVHFLHVKPPANKYKTVIPLLLAHGWPGNVYEFYKIIPLLTDPNNKLKPTIPSTVAFEVIAPSIPGYGWSEAGHKSGLNQIATARIFKKLVVERLGHDKFIAQGGDWGSAIVGNIGRMYPEHVYGIHMNSVFFMGNVKGNLLLLAGTIVPKLVYANREFDNFSFKTLFLEIIKESGYMHIQATKPDTIGVGLNDSPLGLMAYIIEKFSTWTNAGYRNLPDGGLLNRFTQDELLTIVSIYWFNQNILQSQRYYREFFADQGVQDFSGSYLKAPTGYASPPHDLGERIPPEVAKTMANVTHFTLLQEGGHFTAFEVPVPLANDIFNFAAKVAPVGVPPSKAKKGSEL